MKPTIFVALLMIVGFLHSPLVAAPISFMADLDGPSESPANASPGIGFATVTIDSVAHTMTVDVTFSALTDGNTAAHIHVINGPGDANTSDTVGPVATTTPTFPGFPSGVTAGAYNQTLDMTDTGSYRAGWITDSGGTTALAEAELFSGITSGRAYLNIHTPNFPAGEIRGFLVPVPEPISMGLLSVALVGLFAFRRERLRRGCGPQ